MTKLTTDKILETAIEIEEQSYALDMTAREKAERPWSQKFLKELAQEELAHRNKLEIEYDEHAFEEN